MGSLCSFVWRFSEFSKAFYLKPKYVNQFGVNITYFSATLKRIMRVFDNHYQVNGSVAAPVNQLPRQATRKNVAFPSINMDLNHSGAREGRPNSFFVTSSANFTNSVVVRNSKESLVEEMSERDLEGGYYSSETEIIRDFESKQGGIVVFKIPKTFIDNQSKRVAEKESIPEFKTYSNKMVGVPKKDEEQHKASGFMMVKIKLKLRKILLNVREKMRKSSHYTITARVQIICMKHKNLIVKALIVRNIESASWESKKIKSQKNIKISKKSSPHFILLHSSFWRLSSESGLVSEKRNDKVVFPLSLLF